MAMLCDTTKEKWLGCALSRDLFSYQTVGYTPLSPPCRSCALLTAGTIPTATAAAQLWAGGTEAYEIAAMHRPLLLRRSSLSKSQ